MIKNDIEVWKLGGKGIATSRLFKEVARIILPEFKSPQNIFVLSAKEGITRILISISDAQRSQKESEVKEYLNHFNQSHNEVIEDLFEGSNKDMDQFKVDFQELENLAFSFKQTSYEEIYPSMLQYGEILSTKILSAYLQKKGIENIRLDIRELLKTQGNNCEADIKEPESEKLIARGVPKLFKDSNLIIIPGFIGQNYETGHNSILALDGSDISAAFIAHSLEVRKMTYLKDVRGVCMNHRPAPNFMDNIYPSLTFGAYLRIFNSRDSCPVHVKAIEILSRRSIPTRVCSFHCPSQMGTEITR